MKKYTIKDLREGLCAAKNDGTLDEMQEVLMLAFPKDNYRFGNNAYINGANLFLANKSDPDRWMVADKTNLPTQSVKDFLEWKPELGDMVLVRDNDQREWEPRIFLAEIVNANTPFTAVCDGDEDDFRDGLIFSTIPWAQMKQIEAPEPSEPPIKTIEVEVTLNGKNINPMLLTKEQWNKIRTNEKPN